MPAEQSIGQMAKNLGISHFYLSQLKNGRRPPGHKLVSNAKAKIVTSYPSGGMLNVFGGPDSKPGQYFASLKFCEAPLGQLFSLFDSAGDLRNGGSVSRTRSDYRS